MYTLTMHLLSPNAIHIFAQLLEVVAGHVAHWSHVVRLSTAVLTRNSRIVIDAAPLGACILCARRSWPSAIAIYVQGGQSPRNRRLPGSQSWCTGVIYRRYAATIIKLVLNDRQDYRPRIISCCRAICIGAIREIAYLSLAHGVAPRERRCERPTTVLKSDASRVSSRPASPPREFAQ